MLGKLKCEMWVPQCISGMVDQGGAGETECLTCSLIQMGSSLAYGDNSCPQCGASTSVRFT